MVTLTSRVRPPWEDAHFVGGHLVLDLTNTVFDRTLPAGEDVELLRTPSDVLSWCLSAGLFDEAPDPVAGALVTETRTVREQAWAVFDTIARGGAAPAGPFGALLERAGKGLRASAGWAAPGAIPAALALQAVEAVFTLPPARIRACGRCGWLFLDSSRGGRRRWCSMSICGNREKARRHRQNLTS
uniref:CGNR zinc finger domain-containing protein n=1 Tax=Herbidospora sakaeratensis TaxID=564415 RepID=UPI0007810A97|nr:CGNR zinc finger domain-containing protein [Herbidospora sakaeratensis]